MQIIKYIKLLLLLLTFLLGATPTHAKTELILPQNQVVFSVEQTPKASTLKKEVQPNVGFLKEKYRFVVSESVSAVNTFAFSESVGGKLAQGVDDYFNGLVNASDYILNGTYIQGVKKIDLFGGSVSQIGGDFVNIDLLATKGIKGDVSDLSKFIPSNSIDEMIVSNPFPNAPFSGPRDFFLSETSKVMKPGSKITINGTISNKFFKKIKAGNIEDLGFEILEYQIPLKAEFQNIIFYQVDGITQIPSGNMLTTVIRKL